MRREFGDLTGLLRSALPRAILIGAVVFSAIAAGVPSAHAAQSNPRDAALIVDGMSGRVLYERNADEIRYPASLTKMMTMYLLFEALDRGAITLDTQIATSQHAAAQSPTKLNLRVGETISVKTAIEAIVIRSANDVAVVIADALGGSEANFGEMMTRKARDLGMVRTHFNNASGLPDKGQITTAREMALLGRRIAYDFPQYYPYFALPDFTFKGNRYKTHDNLLAAFGGTDGIKTGYTRASGFNLVTSVVRNNRHLVGVVMGGSSAVSRDNEMMRILSLAFDEVNQDPLLVAYANVPWLDDSGLKTFPVWSMPAPPTVVLASFMQGESGRQIRQQRAVVTAVAPKNAVLPRAKPVARAPEQDLSIDNTSFAAATQLAAALPAPKPNIQNDPRNVVGTAAAFEEGDFGGPSFGPRDPAERWSVQIGAFEDPGAADTQLSKSAEQFGEVLGQALRLVSPVTVSDGSTRYRARFGLFVESEARAVCSRMTSQGEPCFATQ